MASKPFASTALLLSLNLLFFTFLTSIPPSAAYISPPSCSHNIPDLGVCVDVLNVLNIDIGKLKPCCSLIGDLVKLEVDACICDAIKLNILNLLKVKLVDLSLLVNLCKDQIPRHFQCA